MRKLLKYGWLVGMCVLFASGLAVADDMAPIVPQHNFEVSLVSNYFEYEEPDVDIKVDGFMYGAIGSYTHHNNNKLMVNASLEFSYGDLDYDGQTWGGIPLKKDTRDWIVEGRFLLGYDHFVRGTMNYLITPYVGFGLRYWNNDIEYSVGYEREIRYVYLPIGIKINSRLSDNWKWRINAEYDLLAAGRVKSHFSDIDPGFNDPVVEQDFGDGYGLRFSLGFTRELGKKYALSIEPYITYWDIDESDNALLTFDGMPIIDNGWILYVYEPANETMSYGLRISLEF